MPTLLKILGGIVAGVVLLVACAAGVVYWKSGERLKRTYAVEVPAIEIPTDAAAIARGRHIAATRGCVDCHGQDLGGAEVIDDPAMGRIHGPNLTRGRGGLPAGYAAADFVRAIRHGVAADGHGLFLMPSTDYAHFTENDMADLIAYVTSVPPVDRANVPLTVGPVARALMLAGKIRLAAEVIDHAAVRPEVVAPGVTVAYGRYLAIGCTGCHGSKFAGGKIDIGPPDWPPAANLTPHASGRLAKWTEDDFIRTLRTARRPDGTELNAVMPRAFGQLDDTELKAIWAFLRTLPPEPTGTR
jgi:mono/diheme cytochrome c family protein